MPMPSPEYGFSSARRILPLGIILGLLLLSPLVWYLMHREGVTAGDIVVYIFASVSVIVAFFVFVLLFLWGAEYADEGETDGEREVKGLKGS
jgi:hypothetical protein